MLGILWLTRLSNLPKQRKTQKRVRQTGQFQDCLGEESLGGAGAGSPPGGLPELSRFGGRSLGPVPLISTAFGPTGIRGRSLFLFGMITSRLLAVSHNIVNCRGRPTLCGASVLVMPNIVEVGVDQNGTVRRVS